MSEAPGGGGYLPIRCMMSGRLTPAAVDAGVAVIVQPGGAMRDEANIERADELGVAMVFTGERHFLH